jgi:hypothetical protein
MKEIKRVFVESKQYGVEEIQLKNWKNIRVYVNYEGYKKQGAIEVREDGFYLEGIRGEETDRGIEFKNTKWLGAYIGFNNDHSIVVEFVEEKKEEIIEETKKEEITFEYKKEGLFLLADGKVREMTTIYQRQNIWLAENGMNVYKTEEEAVEAAKKILTSEYKGRA